MNFSHTTCDGPLTQRVCKNTVRQNHAVSQHVCLHVQTVANDRVKHLGCNHVTAKAGACRRRACGNLLLQPLLRQGSCLIDVSRGPGVAHVLLSSYM